MPNNTAAPAGEALRKQLDIICNSLQYDPSGRWGAETIGPIRAAIAALATSAPQSTEAQPANSTPGSPEPEPVSAAKPRTFSLIVTDPCRLPSALTGVALRIEKFTVSKMSTCRWLIELPPLTQEKTNELLEAIPAHVADVHEVT